MPIVSTLLQLCNIFVTQSSHFHPPQPQARRASFGPFPAIPPNIPIFPYQPFSFSDFQPSAFSLQPSAFSLPPLSPPRPSSCPRRRQGFNATESFPGFRAEAKRCSKMETVTFPKARPGRIERAPEPAGKPNLFPAIALGTFLIVAAAGLHRAEKVPAARAPDSKRVRSIPPPISTVTTAVPGASVPARRNPAFLPYPVHRLRTRRSG